MANISCIVYFLSTYSNKPHCVSSVVSIEGKGLRPVDGRIPKPLLTGDVATDAVLVARRQAHVSIIQFLHFQS